AVVPSASLQPEKGAECLSLLQALDLVEVRLQGATSLVGRSLPKKTTKLQFSKVERTHAQIGAPQFEAGAVEVRVSIQDALEGEGGNLEVIRLEGRDAEPVIEFHLPGMGRGQWEQQGVCGG